MAVRKEVNYDCLFQRKQMTCTSDEYPDLFIVSPIALQTHFINLILIDEMGL